MVAKARIMKITPGSSSTEEVLEVDFNPASLRVGRTSYGQGANAQQTGGDAGQSGAAITHQLTTFSVTLSVELLFDRTQTNEDVTNVTNQIIDLMKPASGAAQAAASDTSKVARVMFQYGTFIFTGMITRADETIDYFSEDGVPLRSTLSLSMQFVPDETAEQQARAANQGFGAAAGLGIGASVGASASLGGGISASAGVSFGASVGTTPLTLANAGESLQSLSARASVDWRAVATANNIDNPRKLQAGAVLNLRVR